MKWENWQENTRWLLICMCVQFVLTADEELNSFVNKKDNFVGTAGSVGSKLKN